MDLQRPNITLGTAGHIDHGKTALIRYLTGCETDRLKEEKERGMSIELGFAPCRISNLEVGIVDVPGHENFIKTMVAGATGMDGVIFVVAADDGIMPQTREHFDILTLLGIKHGIVALTKIDRVDREHVEIVKAELEDFLRGTFLEGAPILPLSNITGDGYDPFYMALMGLIKTICPKSTEGLFRMPVERAFSLKGYGTVVSGIAVSGSAKIGDELELLPQGQRSRVSGIQVYRHQSEKILAGQCAALNVKHWDHTTIRRGDTVAIPGYFSSQEWYACRLTLLEKPGLFLKSGTHVKFHTGTSEVTARVFPMESRNITGGQEAIIQLHLETPIVAGPGDHFIIRSISPLQTIGGGVIVEAIPRKLRRTHEDVRIDLRERADAVMTDKEFVEYSSRKAASFAITSDELSQRTKLPVEQVERLLAELQQERTILPLARKLYIHTETLREKENQLTGILREFHSENPQNIGMTVQQVAEATGLFREVISGILEKLAREGSIIVDNEKVSLAKHRPMFSDTEQRLIDSVEPVFVNRLFNPPSVEETAEETGLPANDVGKALRLLTEHKRIIRLPDGIYFHINAIECAKEILADFFSREERLESVKFKYLLDTTRKYAIPLLDYMDKIGVTRRVGNTRYRNK